MRQILSKTTFLYGCQCPKRLYLNKFHKNLADPEEEAQQIIFQRGTDVGLLAQHLFPDGVNAQGNEEWHSYKTVQRTEKLLPVHSIIYEAAFMHSGVLCAVDLLIRKGKKYYAYEVKSTNDVKPQHITDAALQYHVLTQAGIELADFSIVHFNREYTKIGKIDVQQLFMATSILENIRTELPFIAPKIEELKSILSSENIPTIETGKHCIKPYPCNFHGYCGYVSANTEKAMATDQTIHFNNSEISSFVHLVKYPIYFLDFETIMYGIPEFDYSTPYQQIPFQYSLHKINTPDSKPIHTAFLGDGTTDPRIPLLEQMLFEIGNNGSVLVWNKTFEKSCILKMAKQFPEYELQLLSIVERMEDLMTPFQKKYIASDLFYGSYSIKNILPVLVPELSYSNLEINNGTLASSTYGLLNSISAEQQIVIRKQLLEYCHLDTLAMVKIWEKLQFHI